MWPSASSKSAGAQPRATGLLKKALNSPAWEHPGGSLFPEALGICLALSGLGFHMTYKVVCFTPEASKPEFSYS